HYTLRGNGPPGGPCEDFPPSRTIEPAAVAARLHQWRSAGDFSMIADMGVPMLFVQLPLLVIVLLPVIALETLVLQRRLGLRVGRALVGATLANLASTFVGFPLAWSALLILQLVTGGLRSWGLGNPALRLAAVTWQAPWLVPYDDDLYWMIPAASL